MKLSKYVIIMLSVFFVGIIFFILSPLAIVINVLALIFLGAGFLMLAYLQHKNYKKLKSTINLEKQELILEMATEEGGEAYVYNKSKELNKQEKRVKSFFRDRLLTIIACYAIGFMLLYFSIRLILMV